MSNEQTPAPTTAPQESLALRYSYDELRAPYKGYADQVSALMKAYGDILAIQDPAQRQGAIDQLKSWVSGTAPTREQLSSVTGPLADAARALGLGAGMDAATGVAGAVGTGVRVAGAVGNGMMLPLDFAKGILGFGSDVVNEGWNSQLSDAQAREIGTAYGSVLQAQSENRGGMFASFGNAWAYTRAAFATAWDFIRPLLAQLPWVGQYFDGQAPTRSFDEHLQRALVDTDMGIVRDEFAKVPEIGGINGARLGEFLSRGGVAQDAAGNNMQIAAPSSDNPTPNAPGAPVDANGNPIAADASVTGTVGDAVRRAGNSFTQRVGERLSGIDTPEEVVAAGLAAAGTGLAARGAAETLVRRHVVNPANRAERAETNAAQRGAAMEERLRRAEAGERRSIFRGAEDPEKLRPQVEEARARWERAAERAERMGSADDRIQSLRGGNAMARGIGGLAEHAGESLSWKNPFNWPRLAGRGIGHTLGFVTEPVVHSVGQSVAKDVETTRSMWTSVRSWFGASDAAAGGAAGAAQVAEEAAEAAAKPSIFARMGSALRRVPKVGALFGLAGAGATAAATAVNSDEAETTRTSRAAQTAITETAEKAPGFFSRLFGNRWLSAGGKLAGRAATPVALVLGGAEIAHAADNNDGHGVARETGSLIGGIVGGAATGAAAGFWFGGWGAIPGGIVGAIAGAWGGGKISETVAGDYVQHAYFDGAAGRADAGLQVAAVDQTQRAQEAARNAALAFRSGNVMQGAVLRNEDGSLRALQFGANGQEINARANA